MRRSSLLLTGVLASAALLSVIIAPAAQAKHRIPVPYQTMPFNDVTVTPGGTAEFLYVVECPSSYGTEADCTLVIVERPGMKVVPVARIHLGMRPVVNFSTCAWPDSICCSDTCRVDLKRGSYEWYVSATMMVGGTPLTNTSFAMNPLRVVP